MGSVITASYVTPPQLSWEGLIGQASHCGPCHSQLGLSPMVEKTMIHTMGEGHLDGGGIITGQ